MKIESTFFQQFKQYMDELIPVDRIEIDYERERMVVFYNVEYQRNQGITNPLLSTEGLIPLQLTITNTEV